MTSMISHAQIDDLELQTDKPLLLCDVDEVVVHFLKGLERWLDRNGMWLDPASFALNGNIKYKSNNQPIDEAAVGAAIMGFFEDTTHELEAIEDAANSLREIAEQASVIMLTNLPAQFREARIKNLASHGLDFPVVTNSGPKGPAIAAIAGNHSAPVAFIDDHVGYLGSAAEHMPEIKLVHFMQDERFGRHVEHQDFIHHRTDNWLDASAYIQSALSGNGV